MNLSDSRRGTARPTGRNSKLSDGHGLYLHVWLTGSRHRRLDDRLDGKPWRSGFIPRSASLKRAGLDKARKLLREGINPAQQRKIERIHRAHASTPPHERSSSSSETIKRALRCSSSGPALTSEGDDGDLRPRSETIAA